MEWPLLNPSLTLTPNCLENSTPPMFCYISILWRRINISGAVGGVDPSVSGVIQPAPPRNIITGQPSPVLSSHPLLVIHFHPLNWLTDPGLLFPALFTFLTLDGTQVATSPHTPRRAYLHLHLFNRSQSSENPGSRRKSNMLGRLQICVLRFWGHLKDIQLWHFAIIILYKGIPWCYVVLFYCLSDIFFNLSMSLNVSPWCWFLSVVQFPYPHCGRWQHMRDLRSQ